MKTLRLVREPSSDMATMGVLEFGDKTLETIERPWIFYVMYTAWGL
jgi:hypothetical protein